MYQYHVCIKHTKKSGCNTTCVRYKFGEYDLAARQHSVDTDTAVSITQQLVNDVTELPRNHRVLLDWKSASQTPEQ